MAQNNRCDSGEWVVVHLLVHQDFPGRPRDCDLPRLGNAVLIEIDQGIPLDHGDFLQRGIEAFLIVRAVLATDGLLFLVIVLVAGG